MRASLVTILLAPLLLNGCASRLEPIDPCCYDGPSVTTRLGDLPVTLVSGQRTTLAEVLVGYRPSTAFIGPALPFEQADIVLDADFSLQPVLSTYDANGNGIVEEPELLALYVRESLAGFGVAVRHLGADTPIWALSTAAADVQGLLELIDREWARLAPGTRKTFRELGLLGRDMRMRSRDNDGDSRDVFLD